MTDALSGAAIGLRKMKQLRSLQDRPRATSEFARKLGEFLPNAATVAFMPSSTTRSIEADRSSIPFLVRKNLSAARSDLLFVEPFLRAAPVPSVHEDRTHDIEVLRSTLEATSTVLSAESLYVVDDMIATGATYTAFCSALTRHWPSVRPILLAYVLSARRGNLFER